MIDFIPEAQTLFIVVHIVDFGNPEVSDIYWFKFISINNTSVYRQIWQLVLLVLVQHHLDTHFP